MSALGSLRRPSAADVRPGTELYDRIIRALRGEHQWKQNSEPSRMEKRCTVSTTVLKESNTVANVAEENFPVADNLLESLPTIETPPMKRPCHVHNGGQIAIVEKCEQGFKTSDEPATSNAASNSTTMELLSKQNLTITDTATRPTPNYDTQTVHSTLVQKLQKVSQIDKNSTKTKSQSKYKPPYKIERSSEPGKIWLVICHSKLHIFLP